MRIERINPKILRTADNLPFPQLLDHFSVAAPAHVGEARDAADRLFALLDRAAEKQIRDAFLADDVGHVVAVDHDGRQIELERLGELDSIKLLDKDWHHLLAEALDELDHQLAPARHLRMAVHGLASGLEPWLARMAAAMCVTTHIGRPAKAGDAVRRHRRAIAVEVDLQRGPDEQVRRVKPGKLAVRPTGAHRAIPPGEVDVGSGAHVGVHAYFRAEAMDLFHPPRLDRGNERGVRVQRPVRGDLALEAELFRVGRKYQLDRGGVEADAMVQPLDPVFRVDALDGHHGCQDLSFRDTGRVASEQRFNIEGLWGRDYEVNPIAGDVHPRQLVNDLVDLCDDNSALERSRFDHGWRILRVRTHVQIARTVGAASNGQGDVRCKVDEIACEQLDIGVDRAEFDLSRLQDPRYRVALRSGEGKIELLCDTFLEKVDVLG